MIQFVKLSESMKTERPKITSVHIKIQEFEGSVYKTSETFKLYDTTAKAVKVFIEAAIKKANNGRK